MHQWYVIQVLSSHEKRVKKTLEENILSHNMTEFVSEIFLPTEIVVDVKDGQQRSTEKRLWPGYLLVKLEMSDETWMFIKSANGVIDFLGGGKPQPLSDSEVETIISDLAQQTGTVKARHAFEIGDRVKINQGVFASFEGHVEKVDLEHGKLNVVVSIFGRETKVEDLEFWQVEEASTDPI
jgi:transcriptional antiterminator NusG